MRVTALASILLLSVLCGVAHAHRDTILTVKGEKLDGLPKKYQPAEFSFKTRKLTIGANTVTIPDGIWKLFGDIKKEPIEFLASWYHLDMPLLPPYLSIGNKNCSFLINLDTLEIMVEEQNDKRITPEILKTWKVTKTDARQHKKDAPDKPETE